MKVKLRTIGIFLALGLSIGGLFFAAKNLKVNKIVCQSQFGPCSEALFQSLAKFRGYPVFESLAAAKSSLRADRQISKFGVRYIIPATLVVEVIEKKAEVALGKQGFEGYILVDKDGYVLSQEKSTSLPIINVADGENINFAAGTRIADNLFFAEKLMRYIFALYSVKLAVYYSDRIEVRLNTGPAAQAGQKVLFPISGDVEVLIGSLNLILSRLAPSNSGLSSAQGDVRMGEIDLRYKNPIIR